jgi:hypothetical protein
LNITVSAEISETHPLPMNASLFNKVASSLDLQVDWYLLFDSMLVHIPNTRAAHVLKHHQAWFLVDEDLLLLGNIKRLILHILFLEELLSVG